MDKLDLQSKAEVFSEEAESWWANLDDGERLEIYFEKNPNKHEKEEDGWYCPECDEHQLDSHEGVTHNDEQYCSEKCVQERRYKE